MTLDTNKIGAPVNTAKCQSQAQMSAYCMGVMQVQMCTFWHFLTFTTDARLRQPSLDLVHVHHTSPDTYAEHGCSICGAQTTTNCNRTSTVLEWCVIIIVIYYCGLVLPFFAVKKSKVHYRCW